MSRHRIVFSPRARQRLEDIAEYLYQKKLSKVFVLQYLQKFETWLETLRGSFLNPASPCPSLALELIES